MIKDIREAAEKVGISVVVTNSTEKIETQLNRITRHEQLPIMLISWDSTVTVTFTTDGFLAHPTKAVTVLLMAKAEDTKKDLMEEKADEMGSLYVSFLQHLYSIIVTYQVDNATPPIPSATYQLVPNHGAGRHSGVLGNFTMKIRLPECPPEVEV